MKITLFVYKDGIGCAQLEVLGVMHVTHDCNYSSFSRIDPIMEFRTSGTTSKDAARDLAMCKRDVSDGFAREIVLNAEPIHKEWKDWGISSTVIDFDDNVLNDPLPQE